MTGMSQQNIAGRFRPEPYHIPHTTCLCKIHFNILLLQTARKEQIGVAVKI
jgi:hypothetical protein